MLSDQRVLRFFGVFPQHFGALFLNFLVFCVLQGNVLQNLQALKLIHTRHTLDIVKFVTQAQIRGELHQRNFLLACGLDCAVKLFLLFAPVYNRLAVLRAALVGIHQSIQALLVALVPIVCLFLQACSLLGCMVLRTLLSGSLAQRKLVLLVLVQLVVLLQRLVDAFLGGFTLRCDFFALEFLLLLQLAHDALLALVHFDAHQFRLILLCLQQRLGLATSLLYFLLALFVSLARFFRHFTLHLQALFGKLLSDRSVFACNFTFLFRLLRFQTLQLVSTLNLLFLGLDMLFGHFLVVDFLLFDFLLFGTLDLLLQNSECLLALDDFVQLLLLSPSQCFNALFLLLEHGVGQLGG